MGMSNTEFKTDKRFEGITAFEKRVLLASPTMHKTMDEHGAILIEDAAESLGAGYKGRQTGMWGTYGAISQNGNNVLETVCYPAFCNKATKIAA